MRHSDLCQYHHRLLVTLNTLRPRQNGRHFPDDIFKCVFLNENLYILIKISPKFVPKGPINNIPALVQMMAWRRPGDKPLSEPMMVSLPTHICVARPQWVKQNHRQKLSLILYDESLPTETIIVKPLVGFWWSLTMKTQETQLQVHRALYSYRSDDANKYNIAGLLWVRNWLVLGVLILARVWKRTCPMCNCPFCFQHISQFHTGSCDWKK